MYKSRCPVREYIHTESHGHKRQHFLLSFNMGMPRAYISHTLTSILKSLPYLHFNTTCSIKINLSHRGSKYLLSYSCIFHLNNNKTKKYMASFFLYQCNNHITLSQGSNEANDEKISITIYST